MEANLKGTETILLVDDEETIIDIIGMALKMFGYQVLFAKGGDEAIQVYRPQQGQISLVILDMLMPKMSGAMVFDLLKKINPEVRVLLTSGYNYDEDAAKIIERGANGFIQKPFGVKELAKKIREILNCK
jgi:two-component system, cell cycle sensor histidine kinase and response regulator CckA